MDAPVFTFKLTGAPDGVSDFDFAGSTLMISKRNTVPSYYNLTAPMTTTIVDAFAARPHGVVQVYKNGVLWEYFNQESFAYYKGPRSSTVTVTGSRQETITGTSATLPALDQMNETKLGNGNIELWMPAFSSNARAGDTVTHRGSTYTVKRIEHQFSTTGLSSTLTIGV